MDNECLFNLTHKQVKNAVRDVLSEYMDTNNLKNILDKTTKDQKERLQEKTNKLIDSIQIDTSQIKKRLDIIMNRQFESELKRIVKLETEKIIKENIYLTIHQLVEKGLTLNIGTRWTPSTKLKVTTDDNS